MSSVEFIEAAVVRGDEYNQYIDSPELVPAQVSSLAVDPVPQEVERLFEIPEPQTFAGINPPPTGNHGCLFLNRVFRNKTLPNIDTTKAVDAIDRENVDTDASVKMLALAYKLDHLNDMSGEVTDRRDSILKP